MRSRQHHSNRFRPSGQRWRRGVRMAMHGIPCVRRGQDGFARPGHPRARARERVGVLDRSV